MTGTMHVAGTLEQQSSINTHARSYLLVIMLRGDGWACWEVSLLWYSSVGLGGSCDKRPSSCAHRGPG